MNKTDSIARRILGWALNRWDRWYDVERGVFIHDSEFQPEQNLQHAMLIVEKLEKFGFTYTTNGVSEVCFNNIRKGNWRHFITSDHECGLLNH